MACALRPRPRHQELSTLAAATHTSPTPRCPSQLDRDGGTLLALVTPALVQETFAVLAQPEGDVQSLKRYEDFLWRCLRTALPHLIEDLDSGSFERPNGVCEEAWGALLSTHIMPVLEAAHEKAEQARLYQARRREAALVLLRACVHQRQSGDMIPSDEVYGWLSQL